LIESQIAGYDATIDLATRREPLVAAWIRRLHEIICEGQDIYTVHIADGQTEQRPLVLGQYKVLPNNVITSDGKVHWYAPPELVATEMERLCDDMKRPEFEEAHPVLQAAYAHYAFVAIHPFTDGNGRVARAIGSVFTYRAASVPLLILADHKAEYFAALESADNQVRQPFVDFLFARCVDAVELVEQSMQSARVLGPSEAKARLLGMYETRGGLTHESVDAAGYKAFAAVQKRITEQMETLTQPPLFTYSLESTSSSSVGGNAPPSGYRRPVAKGGDVIKVVLRSGKPASAENNVRLDFYLPTNSSLEDKMIVIASEADAGKLELRMRDIHPAQSEVADLKISMYVDAFIGSAIERLRTGAKNTLSKAGYFGDGTN
jgi:fido (protein-threonine AMPylation protein)